MKKIRSLLLFAMVAGALVSAAPGRAADLKIGIGTAFTSLDPHFYVATSNIMISRYMFDALVSTDERQRPIPALAVSWKALDDTNWEFKLRPNVKFSDGAILNADDVAASLERAPNVKGSPSSFALYTRSIAKVIVKDPLTLVIQTSYPNPTLPVELSYIFIIPKRLAQASTSDFNSLTAMVGTGPYVAKEYVPNDRVMMTRNQSYWGPKPSWDNVLVRLIANNGARTAALLAGDVDLIDSVPPADFARIEGGGNKTVRAVSNRVIFLGLDQDRDETPYARTTQSTKNPFKDVRVRRALSMAINRELIAERIMSNQAVAAGQFLPDGFFGVSPALKPKFDPEAARALLREAGFGGDIRITLHGPSDRYINASQVLQAIAQMFDRIGVKTEVEMVPWNAYVTRLVERNTSAFLAGWGSVTGETGVSMLVTVATVAPQKGAGGGNRGRYSNKELDDVLGEAMRTMDNDQRSKLLIKASEIAINDVGLIPLYFEVSGWALRKGLKMTGRSDQATLAAEIYPE